MLSIPARAGRLLIAHWPALLAIMLGGTLAHFLLLKLAAFVGASSAVGGILLLPLAALALLVAYVAMLLVLRDGMPSLRALAPVATESAQRRTAFLEGVLGGILPFVAFYAAWGFIREDVIAYTNDAFEWQFVWGLRAAVEGRDYDTAGTISDLGFNPLTIGLLVIAFAGRWAFKRYGSRIPKTSSLRQVIGVLAVYLEALWVYLAAYLVTDLVALVTDWVATRQGVAWLEEMRTGLTGWLEPLGVLWDGIGWLLGEAGGIILLPIAWLTIAGVIYGQAVKAAAPRLSGTRFARVRTRYGTLPGRVRRRIGDYWNSLVVGRFRPIGAALALMWRAGPLLIGGYILLFTLIAFGEQWALIGISRALGPHDYTSFWIPASVVIVMAVTVLLEPVRVAVIAAAYDDTVGRLTPMASPADVEAKVGEDDIVAETGAELHDQSVGSVAGEQHDRREVEG